MVRYEDLMQQLDISGLRELEDLIITDCFYPKLLKGNLDQKQRCLQVRPRPLTCRNALPCHASTP